MERKQTKGKNCIIECIVVLWVVKQKQNNECNGKRPKELKYEMESKELSHICHLNIRFWSELRFNRFERKRTINNEWKGTRMCTDNYYYVHMIHMYLFRMKWIIRMYNFELDQFQRFAISFQGIQSQSLLII